MEITVKAIAPHAIETDMSRQWPEEKRKSIIAAIPLGRLSSPEEVAASVVFLASHGIPPLRLDLPAQSWYVS